MLCVESCMSFVLRYKGGPALPRKMMSVGNQQKQFSVEVFPLSLRLIDSRDQSEVIIRLSKKVRSSAFNLILSVVISICHVLQEDIIFLDTFCAIYCAKRCLQCFHIFLTKLFLVLFTFGIIS